MHKRTHFFLRRELKTANLQMIFFTLQNVGNELLSFSFISCDLLMVWKVENAYREEVGGEGAVSERLWDLNLIWAVAYSLLPLSSGGGGWGGGGFECLVLTQ